MEGKAIGQMKYENKEKSSKVRLMWFVSFNNRDKDRTAVEEINTFYGLFLCDIHMDDVNFFRKINVRNPNLGWEFFFDCCRYARGSRYDSLATVPTNCSVLCYSTLHIGLRVALFLNRQWTDKTCIVVSRAYSQFNQLNSNQSAVPIICPAAYRASTAGEEQMRWLASICFSR